MNRRTFLKTMVITGITTPVIIANDNKCKWICLQDKLPKIRQKVILLNYGTSSYLIGINWLEIDVVEIVPRYEIVEVNSIYARTPYEQQIKKLPYKAQISYDEDRYGSSSVIMRNNIPIEYIRNIKWIRKGTEVWQARTPYTLLTGETLIHSNAFWMPMPKDINDIYPLPKKETRIEKLYHKK